MRYAYGTLSKVWRKAAEHVDDEEILEAAVRRAASHLFLHHRVFMEAMQTREQLQEIVMDLGLMPNYESPSLAAMVEPFLKVYGLDRLLVRDRDGRYADDWMVAATGTRVRIGRESVVHPLLEKGGVTFLLATEWREIPAGRRGNILLGTELSQVSGEQLLKLFPKRFSVERSGLRYSKEQGAVVGDERWFLDSRTIAIRNDAPAPRGKEAALVMAQAIISGAAAVPTFESGRPLLAELREAHSRSAGKIPVPSQQDLEAWILKQTREASSLKDVEKVEKVPGKFALTWKALGRLTSSVNLRQRVAEARLAYPDVLELHGCSLPVRYDRDHKIVVTLSAELVPQVLPRFTSQDRPKAWSGRDVCVATYDQFAGRFQPWTTEGLDELRRLVAAQPHYKRLAVNASADDILSEIAVQHPDRAETIFIAAGSQTVFLSREAALAEAEELVAAKLWNGWTSRPAGDFEIPDPENLEDTRPLPTVRKYRVGQSPFGKISYGFGTPVTVERYSTSDAWASVGWFRKEEEAEAALAEGAVQIRGVAAGGAEAPAGRGASAGTGRGKPLARPSECLRRQ